MNADMLIRLLLASRPSVLFDRTTTHDPTVSLCTGVQHRVHDVFRELLLLSVRPVFGSPAFAAPAFSESLRLFVVWVDYPFESGDAERFVR